MVGIFFFFTVLFIAEFYNFDKKLLNKWICGMNKERSYIFRRKVKYGIILIFYCAFRDKFFPHFQNILFNFNIYNSR